MDGQDIIFLPSSFLYWNQGQQRAYFIHQGRAISLFFKVYVLYSNSTNGAFPHRYQFMSIILRPTYYLFHWCMNTIRRNLQSVPTGIFSRASTYSHPATRKLLIFLRNTISNQSPSPLEYSEELLTYSHNHFKSLLAPIKLIHWNNLDY